MPELISDSPNSPDVGAIEDGSFPATADAVQLLFQQLQLERQIRAQEIARLERRIVALGG